MENIIVTPLLIWSQNSKIPEILFEINKKGEFILRGKIIAEDKEVVEVIMKSLRKE